jgi:hypothetical protein
MHQVPAFCALESARESLMRRMECNVSKLQEWPTAMQGHVARAHVDMLHLACVLNLVQVPALMTIDCKQSMVWPNQGFACVAQQVCELAAALLMEKAEMLEEYLGIRVARLSSENLLVNLGLWTRLLNGFCQQRTVSCIALSDMSIRELCCPCLPAHT